MNLIEEIEMTIHPIYRDRWPRICAALEAAREMDRLLSFAQIDPETCQIAFREAMNAKNDHCEWYQKTDGTWETGCGACWELLDGPPSKHRMRFCPCCGRALVETPRQEQEIEATK